MGLEGLEAKDVDWVCLNSRLIYRYHVLHEFSNSCNRLFLKRFEGLSVFVHVLHHIILSSIPQKSLSTIDPVCPKKEI